MVLAADCAVDADATRHRRAALASARVELTLAAGNEPEDGPRRVFRLAPDLMARLGLCEGELVELATPTCGAALRGWVQAGEAAADAGGEGAGQIRLAPQALAALGVASGARAELRPVPRAPA